MVGKINQSPYIPLLVYVVSSNASCSPYRCDIMVLIVSLQHIFFFGKFMCSEINSIFYAFKKHILIGYVVFVYINSFLSFPIHLIYVAFVYLVGLYMLFYL